MPFFKRALGGRLHRTARLRFGNNAAFESALFPEIWRSELRDRFHPEFSAAVERSTSWARRASFHSRVRRQTPRERIVVLASADDVIRTLDAIVLSPRVLEQVDEALLRTAAALRSSDAMMTWEIIPLELFPGLPASIQSCWVFMLRAGQDTGAERHPNSHQRSLSLLGHGEFQLREHGEWQSRALHSDAAAPLEARWATIPESTWHRWVVGAQDWGVLSFHTVPADQLIEERPSDSDHLDHGLTKQRHYSDDA